MARDWLSRFRAYLWRDHDGVTIATGGRGVRHLVVAGSAAFLAFLSFAFPVHGGNDPGFITSSLADKAPHPVIGQYCMGCHDSEDPTADLAFDQMSLQRVGADSGHWESVLRRVQSGLMPPAGAPRPTPAEAAELVAAISSRLDAQKLPPAPTIVRRLTRNEYRNVIRDLVGLDVDVVNLLPPDPSQYGFDNMSEVLTTSPALVEGYLNAAMKVSRMAVGDTTMPSSRRVFTTPNDLDHTGYIEGRPLGTRGGLRADVLFPVDGEYILEVRSGPGRTLFQKFGAGVMPELDVTVAGRAVELKDGAVRLRAKAGEYPVTAALRDADIGPGVVDLYSVFNVKGAIMEVAVSGPFNPTGVGSTPSREKIFSCMPKDAGEERGCARTIVSRLASRAFRRPVLVGSEELNQLMRHYDQGRSEGDFETGIQSALSYILVDPRFLYKIEYEPVDAAPGTAYEITPIELASRLSFFLWSSIPDDALMQSAVQGRLTEPAELDRQVRRMLADPKAIALVDSFGGQWLRLGELAAAERESRFFNGNLRAAMTQETRLLLAEVILGDRPALELLNANYTFLNERLARHYGVGGVVGDYFRKVSLPSDSLRRGLLGQASLLTVTSVSNRTSPVIRGAWVLENILGVPPSPPPPGVETNLDDDLESPKTLRERLAMHRENPSCASCHNMMDPIGLTLENFDNTGRWRMVDNGSPIDPTATMSDGTKLAGVADLRGAILGKSDSFVTNVTSKLMTYALGRHVGPREMPAVRAIVDDARGNGFRFGGIIRAIATSEPFLTRTKPAAPAIRAPNVQTTRAGDQPRTPKKGTA